MTFGPNYRKVGDVRQPLTSRTGWWLVSFFRVDIVVHFSIEFRKPEVPRDRTLQLFLLSIPMVVLLMKLDDDMNYNIDHLYYITQYYLLRTNNC